MNHEQKEYDAFISHATEDKAAFVEGLANELRKMGLNVWFDKFTLKVGDSLRQSIESGLTNSRFGIVVFSPAFFAKNWTQAELNGLFAREMNGQKVILPIWHGISSKEMLQRAPIQADKVALRSSDGIPVVARALVDTIRPELLSIDNSLQRSSLATAHLKAELEKKYPGYTIRIAYGSQEDVWENPPTDSKNIVISKSDGEMRIDVLVGDAAVIRNNPPGMKLRFHGQGIDKMLEQIRTGKPQTFLRGEFSWHGSNVPLLDNTDLPEGTELRTKPIPSEAARYDVRLVVCGQNGNHEIPILNMSPTRAGREEAEVVLTHRSSPLKLLLTLSERPGPQNVNISTSLAGFDFSQIWNSIMVTRAITDGGELQIFDLATGKRLFHATLNEFDGELFPPEVVTLVELVKRIGDYFKVEVRWPNEITDDDIELIGLLNCLVTGEEYGTNFRGKVEVSRDSPNLSQMLGGPMTSFQEAPASARLVNLFGTQIVMEPWGLYTEQIRVENPEHLNTWLEDAMAGDKISLDLVGASPTFVRWKKELI